MRDVLLLSHDKKTKQAIETYDSKLEFIIDTWHMNQT